MQRRERAGAAPTDAVQNQPLGARCILMDRTGPPMLAGAYNNNYQIVQAPGYVMILVEMLHDVRIIPLDGRPHLPPNVRQWMGSSRGRWEGETLVVETTNFTDKFAFQGSSENMRLTERFTRVDEDTLRYQFTVDDPATWTRPWSAEVPWKKTIRSAIRARLSRRELRLVQHPRWRSGRGEASRRRSREKGTVEIRRGLHMRTRRAVVVVGVGLLLAAAPVMAHHAFSAEFDINKPIKLQGTLTKWEMINPHSWFHIDVKDPDGNGGRLDDRRRQPEPAHQAGVTKNTLAIGTELVIEGYQAKDGTNKARRPESSARRRTKTDLSAGLPTRQSRRHQGANNPDGMKIRAPSPAE